MFTYSAYNLCIHSELPLPELIPTSQRLVTLEQLPDVVVRLRKLEPSELEAVDGGNSFLGNSFLGKSEVGRFLVQSGCQIIVEPVPGVEEAVLRSLILGPSLSVLLRQRGLLVLHASCVAINDTAIAFLGNSGWGKSTLAGAFHAKGYSILTDDLMGVQVDAYHPLVIPGFPQVKMWPDTATTLGHTPQSLPLLHSQTEKLVHRFTQGFSQSPLPLKRIFVLTKGPHHAIQILPPQNAFIELVRYSHALKLLKTPDFTKAHFEQCMRLSKHVPVCYLQRQFSLAALPDLLKLVEEDLLEAVC